MLRARAQKHVDGSSAAPNRYVRLTSSGCTSARCRFSMTCTSRTSRSIISRTIAGISGRPAACAARSRRAPNTSSPGICRRPAEHGDEDALRAHAFDQLGHVAERLARVGLRLGDFRHRKELDALRYVSGYGYARRGYFGLLFDCLRCAADALHRVLLWNETASCGLHPREPEEPRGSMRGDGCGGRDAPAAVGRRGGTDAV